MWILVVLHIGCCIYGVVNKENPWDVLYGFPIWAPLPISVLVLANFLTT